jgi:hypothetical protein
LAPSDFHLFGLLKTHLGGKRFANDKEVELEVWKWLRQQSILLCCGFQHTGKAMGQVLSMLVEDMSRYKRFFPGLNITCFTFYINL